MEVLQFTEEHNEFRQRLRSFLEKEVIPYMDQWEKDHIVPKSVWKKMGQAGFLCTNVSEKYGGHGKDFLSTVIVSEELAKVACTGLTATLHSDIVVPYISTYGSEEQKHKYLPGCSSGDIITAVAMTEPGAGSDLASIEATAVEEGDEFVINGSKTFISNGINCDIVIVAAKDPSVENPYESLSLFIVEDGTQGFERGLQLEKMGWHSQDTAELFFNNCRVPKENLLGEKGNGFLMLMGKLQQERLICAMGVQYGAEQAVKDFTEYCKNTTDASDKPLSKSQAVQFALVDMTTEAKLGRAFIDKLIADHMEGIDVKAETFMAKYWITEMSKRTMGKCLEIAGDFGTVEANSMVRDWRDIRVTSIFAGTNEIMRYIIAKLMGL